MANQMIRARLVTAEGFHRDISWPWAKRFGDIYIPKHQPIPGVVGPSFFEPQANLEQMRFRFSEEKVPGFCIYEEVR